MGAYIHTHTHTHTHTYIYIYIYVCVCECVCVCVCERERESKSRTFFFSTGIIFRAGTFIINQNEASLLWITYQLLSIVTVSLSGNVSSSKESMYPCLVKFCWLFLEPLHHCSFRFLVTGLMFCLLNLLSWVRNDDKHYVSDEEVKTTLVKWFKEQSTAIYAAGKHVLIRRWNVAIERNGDYVVIHWGLALFWDMIHVPPKKH